MHRLAISIQDVWKPDSIETMEFPSIIYSPMFVNLKLHLLDKIIF